MFFSWNSAWQMEHFPRCSALNKNYFKLGITVPEFLSVGNTEQHFKSRPGYGSAWINMDPEGKNLKNVFSNYEIRHIDGT